MTTREKQPEMVTIDDKQGERRRTMTTTTIGGILGDPAVRELRQKRDDLQRRLADANARAARPRGVTVVETQEQREAREEAQALELAVVAAAQAADEAEAAARKRIDAAREPERKRLVADVLADAERFEATVRKKLRDYDDATVSLGGSRPDPVFGDFAGRLAVERERFRDKPTAGPPPGMVRLRLTSCLRGLVFRFPGDVVDFEEGDAEDLLRRKLAVPVEA